MHAAEIAIIVNSENVSRGNFGFVTRNKYVNKAP
jgi:hypothetical protein